MGIEACALWRGVRLCPHLLISSAGTSTSSLYPAVGGAGSTNPPGATDEDEVLVPPADDDPLRGGAPVRCLLAEFACFFCSIK